MKTDKIALKKRIEELKEQTSNWKKITQILDTEGFKNYWGSPLTTNYVEWVYGKRRGPNKGKIQKRTYRKKESNLIELPAIEVSSNRIYVLSGPKEDIFEFLKGIA